MVSNAVPRPEVTLVRPFFKPSTLSALLSTASKEPTAEDIPITVPMKPSSGIAQSNTFGRLKLDWLESS